jgi:GTPase
MPKLKKSGFVTIIGRPNVGKSTLLNCLVGEKLAGVSPKPQTTRDCIRGIVSTKEGQIVFLDTPGLHDPRDLLGSRMVREAQNALEDADLVYWMVLPGEIHPHDTKVLEVVKKIEAPVILVISQIDRFAKPEILPVLDHYHKLSFFKEMIPISAKKGDQLDVLIEKTFEYLPEGQPFFPPDQITDQSEKFIVAEIIREKLFRFTSEEVPYATAVVIDVFKERSATLTDIEATIVVEKDSQKAIVIGKGGSMLKDIGSVARKDIEQLLGKKVFLKLWVKPMESWKNNSSALRELGYQ